MTNLILIKFILKNQSFKNIFDERQQKTVRV